MNECQFGHPQDRKVVTGWGWGDILRGEYMEGKEQETWEDHGREALEGKRSGDLGEAGAKDASPFPHAHTCSLQLRALPDELERTLRTYRFQHQRSLASGPRGSPWDIGTQMEPELLHT